MGENIRQERRGEQEGGRGGKERGGMGKGGD